MMTFVEQWMLNTGVFDKTWIGSENQIYTGRRCVSYVCWLIYWLYSAVDIEDLISFPSGESLWIAYHLEDLALKSSINMEQPGFKSLIF